MVRFNRQDVGFSTEGVIAEDYLANLPTDETKLTENELINKLAALNAIQGDVAGINKKAGEKKAADMAAVKKQILDELNVDPGFTTGKSVEDLDKIAGDYTNKLVNNEFKDAGSVEDFFANRLGYAKTKTFLDTDLIKAGKSHFNDKTLFVLPENKDLANQIKNTTDLLRPVVQKRVGTEKADRFISNLPSELATSRNQFLQSQIDPAKRYFQEQLAPEILQTANVKGTLFSGDLSNELARGVSSVQSGLENTQLDLMSQDDQFFQNAGYQEALRRAIESGVDVTADIAAKRATATQEQGQRFISSQADLNRQQQAELFRSQSERALVTQQQRLEQEKNVRERKNRSGLYGLLGTGIGATIGSFAGPVGATLGATFGSQLGTLAD